MVAHTRPQATPRREKYSSTPATRVESTHDHTFGRVRPPEGRSSRFLMGMLLFHEVVRNHMHDYQMQVFDSSGVPMDDLNIELRQRPQAATLPARESDGPAADGITVLHGAQNIRRVAGTADRDHHIPRFGKVLQLLDEHAFVADVVGVGCDRRQRIGEGQDAEARSPAIAGALDQVRGEMRWGGGPPAVPAHENATPFGTGLGQEFDRPSHLFEVDRLDRMEQLVFIQLRKNHGLSSNSTGWAPAGQTNRFLSSVRPAPSTGE